MMSFQIFQVDQTTKLKIIDKLSINLDLPSSDLKKN